MQPIHVPILKANKGECEALRRLGTGTARKIRPLFEVGRLTEVIRERQYIRRSATPTMTFLDRVLDAAGDVWSSRSAMIDGYHWAADALVENGSHAIAYMVTQLRSRGVDVIPVVGYDRWPNAVYRAGMRSIDTRSDGQCCLRLDASAIEDAAEPQHFQDIISDIIDELNIDSESCSILLDFGDVSTSAMPVDRLVAHSERAIALLQTFRFGYYIVAGCSLPRSINLAVERPDTQGLVLRKEMLTWRTLRESIPSVRIVSGDYGVRGPTTTEAPSPHTNGKIRHTVNMRTFVVRGHAFSADHSNAQMEGLADILARSPHYLGENFSWGNAQIERCRTSGAFGNASTWIAIDTNHHLTFVVQEVEEFERDLVKIRSSAPARTP